MGVNSFHLVERERETGERVRVGKRQRSIWVVYSLNAGPGLGLRRDDRNSIAWVNFLCLPGYTWTESWTGSGSRTQTLALQYRKWVSVSSDDVHSRYFKSEPKIVIAICQLLFLITVTASHWWVTPCSLNSNLAAFIQWTLKAVVWGRCSVRTLSGTLLSHIHVSRWSFISTLASNFLLAGTLEGSRWWLKH